MKPSALLAQQREAIHAAVARHRAANPRVFGSALRGEEHENSDLDLLVNALPGATLFDLGGLQDELETLLGIHVDVLTSADLPQRFRQQVLNEARPL